MRKAAFAAALLIGGAAFAQTGGAPAYEGDGLATAAFETEAGAAAPAAGTGAALSQAAPDRFAAERIVQPSNHDPERDARGIAVVSDPAVVPPGWNGVPAAAMGGPELDPATGEPVGADAAYPACTASVTDNCLQTYEVRRRR